MLQPLLVLCTWGSPTQMPLDNPKSSDVWYSGSASEFTLRLGLLAKGEVVLKTLGNTSSKCQCNAPVEVQ
jgi:hypothetical protein